MIELFTPGLIDYPEKMINKPVRYTEADLERIADRISQAQIIDGHGGDTIGTLDNIIFKDGALYADVPDDLEITGKGLSPEFHFGLIDRGEYYEPYDIRMGNVALTSKPKSQIFYNSIKGDVEMDLKEKEELLNTIKDNQKRIREQEQEIGILKNKNETLKNDLNSKNDTDKELKSKLKELEDLKAEVDGLRAKAEAYDNIEVEEKNKLIEEIANGNDEIRERLSNMPLDDIKFLNEKKLLNTDPKGVPAGSAPGLQDGSQQGEGDKKDKPATYEDYQKWKKENNVR